MDQKPSPQSGPITLRKMMAEDIPFGVQLSTGAGWNQTEADWQMLLANSVNGSYVASYNGIKAGTVTTVTYGERIHWIGMVLVAPEYHRMGIGTALVEAVLTSLEGKGTVYLDATPQGHHLYEHLGFKDVYPLNRCLRSPGIMVTTPRETILPISPEFLPQILKYDVDVFGVDRSRILTALFRRAPHLAFKVIENGKVSGYCMGRKGRRYTQVGPLLGDDFKTASYMLTTVVGMCQDQPIIVDTHLHHADWNQYLTEIGFKEGKVFIRMRFGDCILQEQPNRHYAITGPEIG